MRSGDCRDRSQVMIYTMCIIVNYKKLFGR